jgi:hypothetical protein
VDPRRLVRQPLVAAWTRTASFTWFGGYVGTVCVLAYDANGLFLGTTEEQRYGVNGTAFGGSDRAEGWAHEFGGSLPGQAARLVAVHGWRFEARTIAKVAEAIKEIGPILAMVFL